MYAINPGIPINFPQANLFMQLCKPNFVNLQLFSRQYIHTMLINMQILEYFTKSSFVDFISLQCRQIHAYIIDGKINTYLQIDRQNINDKYQNAASFEKNVF